MWITEFALSRFGIFVDQQVTDLPPGLVVFSGANESGKTTLMHFFRYIFFGLPRNAGNNNLYAPFDGSLHGAQLTLRTDADGETPYTIDMQGRRVALRANPQGRTLGDLLGNLDQETFERIFCLGLEDLQGLKVLQGRQIQSRLFAAGAGLGVLALPDLLQELDQSRKALYALGRSRGGKGTVNLLLEALRSGERELRELENTSSRYWNAVEERRMLEAKLRNDEEELGLLVKRMAHLELLEKARGAWGEYDLSRKELADFQGPADFPERGGERMADLVAAIADLEAGLREDEAVLRDLAVRKWQVETVTPRALLENAELVSAVRGERGRFSALVADIPRRTQQMSHREESFREALRQTGPDWTEERLFQVDLAFDVLQEAYRQEEEILRLQESRRRGELLVDEGRKRLDAAEVLHMERGALLSRLEVPAVQDPEKLQRQREGLGRLRVFFSQRAPILLGKNLTQEQMEAASAELRRKQDLRPRAAATVPLWLSLLCLLAGLGAALGAHFFREQLLWFLAALAGAFALVIGVRAWHQMSQDEQRYRQWREDLDEKERETVRFGERIRTFEEELGTLERLISELADDAGVMIPQSLEALEMETLTLTARETELKTFLDAKAACAAALRDRDQAESSWKSLQAEAELLREEEKKALENWNSRLQVYGFGPDVRPGTLRELVARVEKAQGEFRGLEESRRALEEHTTYIRGQQDRVAHLLALAGKPLPEGALPQPAHLENLLELFEAAQERQREMDELDRRLTEAQRGSRLKEETLRQRKDERDRLLKQVGLRDETEFLALADRCLRASELRDLCLRRERELVLLVGHREGIDALGEEIRILSPAGMAREREEGAGRLPRLRQEIDEARHRLGVLDKEIDDLGCDERQSALLDEQARCQSRLRDAVREWLSGAICRFCLEEARRRHERERQPEVIREADRALRVMTGGRYALLAMESGNTRTVELEEVATKQRKREGTWSSGLGDQAYLALRFGLARLFGRKSESLPLILDDLLVRFDEGRQGGAVRVLLEEARQRQVLFFSCHEGTTRLLARVASREAFPPERIAFFRLERGVIRREELVAGPVPENLSGVALS